MRRIGISLVGPWVILSTLLITVDAACVDKVSSCSRVNAMCQDQSSRGATIR